MTAALLTTRLKVADPTALTALSTLRTRLGFGERLRNVTREEFHLFETTLDREGARRLVDGLVRRTNLFLNPNKHFHRLVVEGDAAPSPEILRGPGAYLLVWTEGDGEDLLESMRRHVGVEQVTSLSRGWIWRLEGAPNATPAEMLDLVSRAGVLTSRTSGFLVHPAYQDCRLYAGRPSLYDVRDALSTVSKGQVDE
jgi:hypothetical protein